MGAFSSGRNARPYAAVAAFLCLSAGKLAAQPLRSLQTGPVGRGVVFATSPAGSVEGQLTLSSSQGLARGQTSGDRILSDAQRTGVAVAALHPLSESFWFHSGGAVQSWDYHAVSRGSRSFNERVSQTAFEATAGPILRKGAILLGGKSHLTSGVKRPESSKPAPVRGAIRVRERLCRPCRELSVWILASSLLPQGFGHLTSQK